MIRTASSIDISSVSDAQIGACHKIIHRDGNFYMVESASDPDREYKVTWTREKGFQCQCKAAEYGNLCWHIRASIAAVREEREAVAELELAIAELAAPIVSSAPTIDMVTMARIAAANERQAAKPVSRAKANSPKGFSLLRV